MDDYEAEITRQPRGPFSKVAERQLIRASSEHWGRSQRYVSERNRRIALYFKWIGVAGGAALAIYKLAEAFLGKAV